MHCLHDQHAETLHSCAATIDAMYTTGGVDEPKHHGFVCLCHFHTLNHYIHTHTPPGAVGYVVGQLCKNVYGCKVVGSAGSDDKVGGLEGVEVRWCLEISRSTRYSHRY